MLTLNQRAIAGLGWPGTIARVGGLWIRSDPPQKSNAFGVEQRAGGRYVRRYAKPLAIGACLHAGEENRALLHGAVGRPFEEGKKFSEGCGVSVC